ILYGRRLRECSVGAGAVVCELYVFLAYYEVLYLGGGFARHNRSGASVSDRPKSLDSAGDPALYRGPPFLLCGHHTLYWLSLDVAVASSRTVCFVCGRNPERMRCILLGCNCLFGDTAGNNRA